MPSLYKALHVEHANQYMEAMKQAINLDHSVDKLSQEKYHQIHLGFQVEVTSRWISIQVQGDIMRPRRLARRGGLL
jgi:hypothetical protein